MAYTYDMVHIAQRKLQKLVREDCSCVRKAKEAVICEDSSQSHRPGMQNSFMTQTTETGMTVDYLDPFAYDNVAKDREEGEDGWEGSLAVDDEEGHVIDLQPVGEIPHTCSSGVRMRDDYDFVPSIDEFLSQFIRRLILVDAQVYAAYGGQLVHVTLYTSYIV